MVSGRSGDGEVRSYVDSYHQIFASVASLTPAAFSAVPVLHTCSCIKIFYFPLSPSLTVKYKKKTLSSLLNRNQQF
ncbi:hypothetical protein XELAEV_18010756mg [Xenopus laevis]|uniref:Uncharacterized protein n=1 Tax=Xenopus laevis TaxID=8355 RepID=A0A974I285_XENLA|nr:hypothetical protein XELAEV_18010756mg [Xenopus laevis]